MVIQPLIGNPYNGYINPYYWVDDHPLLYGNNGSLDPSTYSREKIQDFPSYLSQMAPGGMGTARAAAEAAKRAASCRAFPSPKCRAYLPTNIGLIYLHILHEGSNMSQKFITTRVGKNLFIPIPRVPSGVRFAMLAMMLGKKFHQKFFSL